MNDPEIRIRAADASLPIIELDVIGPIVFDLDAHLQVIRPDGHRSDHHLGAAGLDVSWLPRGCYRLECPIEADWPVGTRLEVAISSAGPDAPIGHGSLTFRIDAPSSFTAGWRLGSFPASPAVDSLCWSQGQSSWFYRHFDHAARTLIRLLFNNHPLLRGEILDVGCGDGITDLGLALRTRPKRLVGVDPFRGYERLADICRDHHLPVEVLDCPGLEYRDDDGNALGFDDNSFDVVLSWGSLEHIAGGYAQTLAEIRRVLRPGGLFFAHPGLFYGSAGNHLNEFFDDPWIHLKLQPEELRRRVLAGSPSYMDRAGERSAPEQYWQWYTELNPIELVGFEREMRALDFEPWRFALRTDPVVEYTPELVDYDMATLGIRELYAVFVSRKPQA